LRDDRVRDPGIHWQQKTGLSTALLPLAGLYCLLMALRRLAYRLGVLRAQRLSVPVIVVGNITVGGTGKTPLVIWLAQLLREQGWRPGIVTRGYGGNARSWPQQVMPDSDPRAVGDEPVLLARHAGCPVMAGPDRVADADRLVLEHQCNVIVSDDGLQHYRLGRDIEIALVDGARRYGNGRCLPAGPLREPLKRLRAVQARVANGEAQNGEIGMQLKTEALYNLRSGANVSLAEFGTGDPVHAVAGIGHPARFFQHLRGLGFVVIEHAFADHHAFRPEDIDFPPHTRVIMTEKDAVKCQAYARDYHWYLTVKAVPEPPLATLILKLLKGKKRGQKTA
jgi:tetraacyldisaccharide 4'-kinase